MVAEEMRGWRWCSWGWKGGPGEDGQCSTLLISSRVEGFAHSSPFFVLEGKEGKAKTKECWLIKGEQEEASAAPPNLVSTKVAAEDEEQERKDPQPAHPVLKTTLLAPDALGSAHTRGQTHRAPLT